MGRNRILLAGLAATVAVGVSAGPSFGGPGSTGRTVHVSTRFTDPGAPGFSWFGASCPIQPPAPDGCMLTFTGGTKELGPGLLGSTVYDGKAGYGGSVDHNVRWEVTETFTGSVAGCGTGTLVWHGSGYGDLVRINPMTLGFPLYGTVRIVPGSGTGGLTGITGTFTVDAQATLPFAAQSGTISGDVRCKSPDDASG